MSARPYVDPASVSPEQLVYQGDDVRVGTFDCPVEHPDFRTAGPIEGYTVVFPRSAVWIVPEGRRPFVADPRVIVLYNKGQPYTRRALAAEGDRVEWFSVGPTLVAAIAHGVGRDCDPARPFRAAFVVSNSATYYRQRRFFTRLREGRSDPLLIEQEVVGLVGSAMEAGCLRAPDDQRLASRASREAIEAARAELARDPAQSVTVRELASRVSLSPFHLCRHFRRHTGSTLHHYLMELRVRLALERLEDRAVDLSRLAQDTGFSSHSHFSAAFRRRFGLSPSRARDELRRFGNVKRNPVTATSAA